MRLFVFGQRLLQFFGHDHRFVFYLPLETAFIHGHRFFYLSQYGFFIDFAYIGIFYRAAELVINTVIK